MASDILIVRQPSQIKSITRQETLEVLSDEERASAPEDLSVDMAEFAPDVDNGGWRSSHAFVRERAQAIRQMVAAQEIRRVLYFGVAEIPQIIAIGAYIGDEIPCEPREYDRDRHGWHWPENAATLEVTAVGTPTEWMPASGDAVIRVSITASVTDEGVAESFVGHPLCDIKIGPANGRLPAPGLVRSALDVEAVRFCFREQISAMLEARPGVETIHLFVAAPASICFALGQELRLRNTRPVQTYRYRAANTPKYIEAIRLDERAVAGVSALTAEEVARAADIRDRIWPQALEELKAYARAMQGYNPKVKHWYEALLWYKPLPAKAKQTVRPFPSLPPVWDLISMLDGVDPVPLVGLEDYAFDVPSRKWRLQDSLLVGLARAVVDDEAQLRRLIRLFLFHEYLHQHHMLSKVTAAEVGKFENCLERLDYAADLYALLHEFDLTLSQNAQLESDREKTLFLAQQIEQILASFWAFEPHRPVREWQVRRVRRHLNWYWRRVQVQNAPDLKTALRTLSKPPAIEVAGIRQFLDGRRHFLLMDENRLDSQTYLELGIVTENDSFHRFGDSTNTNLKKLVQAFREGDHESIKSLFQSVFTFVQGTGGAYPPEE